LLGSLNVKTANLSMMTFAYRFASYLVYAAPSQFLQDGGQLWNMRAILRGKFEPATVSKRTLTIFMALNPSLRRFSEKTVYKLMM